MKTRKKISIVLSSMVISLAATFSLNSTATAETMKLEEIKFLQAIQGHLSRKNGIKNIAIHVFVDQKRRIHVTKSSIGLSYGFLKDMQNINQLVATMAHLTAFVKLGYVVTPPDTEEDKHNTANTAKKSFTNFIKSTIRPKFPDENYLPDAKGPFEKDRPTNGAQPNFQNQKYNYAINKKDILIKDRHLEVDKLTDSIMKRAGFCPQDYSRLLHYFYESPQGIPENKHFTMDADEWQRIDTADQRADPAIPCNEAQTTLTQKYGPAFNQLKSKISKPVNTK